MQGPQSLSSILLALLKLGSGPQKHWLGVMLVNSFASREVMFGACLRGEVNASIRIATLSAKVGTELRCHCHSRQLEVAKDGNGAIIVA